MSFERSSLRYAHTNGHTSLKYVTTTDGNCIFTCGSDGDIRKWKGIDDDDPSSSCLGEFVLCIEQDFEENNKNGRLLASTDRNTVQSYSLPEIDCTGTLMRFTALVTCIRATENYIAAGSEDMEIKVLFKSESKELVLQGHKGPILSLDVYDSKKLLASVGGDGVLIVWSLEDGKEIKRIMGFAKSNSFERTQCFGTPVFEPTHGAYLAYIQERTIYVVNTSTWEIQFTLTDEDRLPNGCTYTCCQFSKDGKFLAAGTSIGEISIFDFIRKEAIKCEAVPANENNAITGLSWFPTNNKELAFCDSTGQLGTLFEVAPAKKRNDEAVNEADELDYGDIAFEDDEAVENNGIDADDADNDDEDDENTVSLEKLKNQVMKGSKISEEDEDSKMSVAKSYTSERSEPIVKIKTFKAQAAFQPSSTPSHLEHFYMVWNGVGIVTAHSDNSDNGGSIHVEFHDASVHHALHIPNFNNSHTLASLSTGVLALSGGEDASKLVCIALAASGNKEWSLQMPDTEVIEAVATTKRIVAVVTNINMLRLFSSMGTQREVIGLPGPVVAIAGSETEERFIVVYHSAPPGEHQQYLSAMLVQASYGLGLNAQTINLPLPKGRTLSWLGFSDVGSPAFADSMGLVQLYNTRNNCWYAICDTLQQRQSVSNNYFVIAISERQQILQAVLCRGCSYPMTNPRPMLQELPLRMPLCDLDSEKSEIEDALLRASLMSSMEGSSRIIKETAIKLFALACRSEIELRAKELIETIGCPDLLLLAVKYATKLGRIHLADRLSELMPKIEENQEKKTQEENEILQVHLQQKAQFLQLNSMLSPGGHQSPKVLAPKAMELSSTKRSSLKRLASPFSSALPNNRNNVPSSPSILGESATQDFSQENFGVSENSSTKSAGDTQSDLQRTPLNSVNPFASKRKLADSEVILGSDKLKFPKRDLK